MSLTSWASHRMQLGVSRQTHDLTHSPNLSQELANQHQWRSTTNLCPQNPRMAGLSMRNWFSTVYTSESRRSLPIIVVYWCFLFDLSRSAEISLRFGLISLRSNSFQQNLAEFHNLNLTGTRGKSKNLSRLLLLVGSESKYGKPKVIKLVPG